MAIKQSTGLCQALLTTSDFKTLFDGGYLIIYKGTAPTSADQAENVSGATIICVVADNAAPATSLSRAFGGSGLTFDEPVAGTISAAAAETWDGTVGNSGGVATFYRLVTSSDTGALSTTEARIQGTIGTGGTDMVLGNTTLVDTATFPVNYFTLSLVPS